MTEERERAGTEVQAPVSWQTFVLAASAPLGPYRQVHLAPKFPPGRLNLALRTELPLLEDELLVALIESDSRGSQGTIILTTTRLYWPAQEPPGSGGRTEAKARRLAQVQGLDYALLREPVRVEASHGELTRITLGPNLSLPLRNMEPDLAEALAAFLRTVGGASRAAADASLAGIDPELRRRVEQVLPGVAELTRRIRDLNRDLHTFRRELLRATPRALVTPILTAACVAIYVAMLASGVDPILPAVPQLVSWGANDGARVVLRHEWWRLPASVFIHGGLIHLGVNMWCLFTIGPLVERFFGNLATAWLFLAAGIGGAIASMATMPVRVSVGASGAIFGLLGAILAFLIVHRRAVPASVLRPLRSSALSFVIFNTLFGAAVPNIDQAAHMGGLATGFLGGLLLIRPWPVVRSSWLTFRRLALGLVLAGLLLGVGAALVGWRARTLPALARYQDFFEQIAPAIQEFNAISDAIPPPARLQGKEKDSPSVPDLSTSLRNLRGRARANAGRIRRLTTPDPRLRESSRTLLEGQDSQLSVIDDSLEYLETRDPKVLTGPDGLLARRAAIIRASRTFEEQLSDYLKSNDLDDRHAAPAP